MDTMKYQQAEKVVTRQIGGETLLIPITQAGVDLQKVYLLNETAAAIWAALAQPRSVEELVDLLAQEYQAPDGVLQQDVAGTVHEFATRSFVTEHGDG